MDPRADRGKPECRRGCRPLLPKREDPAVILITRLQTDRALVAEEEG